MLWCSRALSSVAEAALVNAEAQRSFGAQSLGWGLVGKCAVEVKGEEKKKKGRGPQPRSTSEPSEYSVVKADTSDAVS